MGFNSAFKGLII